MLPAANWRRSLNFSASWHDNLRSSRIANKACTSSARLLSVFPTLFPKIEPLKHISIVLFYNVGERRAARCAEKTKTEANAKPNKRVVMFAGYA